MWECQLSVEIAKATLADRYPDLKAKVESSLTFREVTVSVVSAL